MIVTSITLSPIELGLVCLAFFAAGMIVMLVAVEVVEWWMERKHGK